MTTERPPTTEPYMPSLAQARGSVRQFRIALVEQGVERCAWESVTDRCAIGSDPSNDVVIDDPTVSRFHCELRIDDEGPRLIDLRSRNGSFLSGVRVREAFLGNGTIIALGAATIMFTIGERTNPVTTSDRTRFGDLIGHSVAMRAVFARLERAAATASTVLLEGETGTGKGAAAEAIHGASERSRGPFVVVDCGAIPAQLLESELFGHERGAFTSADRRRIGAFEEAHEGTIFLDEIGELPRELQPKLLRALETRQVRRVGASAYVAADVRIIAATNRDLRAEVNASRFRSDLYYRLAVLRVVMPALRERPEDLPVIAAGILSRLGVAKAQAAELLTFDYLAALERMPWPGNVRELRNALERRLAFADVEPANPSGAPPPHEVRTATPALTDRYETERERALAAFERNFVTALLERHGNNVTRAAEAAGIGRVHLHRLIKRHGIRGTTTG